MKRIFDIIISSFLLAVLSPLILLVCLLVKLDTGSVIYKQERLGKNGKEFTLYKFKTMVEEEGIPVLAKDNDERFTKIGNWLRGGLDEIPQLWNVIKGDISLVGPRPERKCFSEKFAKMFNDWNKRLEVEQGITGLAQLHNAGSLDPKRKLKYDLEYIEKRSFLFDLKILGKTTISLIKKYLKQIL